MNKIKIGITGQHGFVGYHLYNNLKLAEEFELVPFNNDYFEDNNKLDEFVSVCDCIVHLAALNRHPDPKTIYDTNIKLVNDLIEACLRSGSNPHIIFSSSTQEEFNNVYGQSKKEGREAFSKWAQENGARFTGLVIPNVFGPYGKPFYNSVVATFCYQLTHEEEPKIQVDGVLKIIYIQDLVEQIINEAKCNSPEINTKIIPHTKEIKVSEILEILNSFKQTYLNQNVFPKIHDKFERDLFNTFICYKNVEIKVCKFYNEYNIPISVNLLLVSEGAGFSCIEVIKSAHSTNEYFSRAYTIRITAMNGSCVVELENIKSGVRENFKLHKMEFIDVPIWQKFKIKNTSSDDFYLLYWINGIPDRTENIFFN